MSSPPDNINIKKRSKSVKQDDAMNFNDTNGTASTGLTNSDHEKKRSNLNGSLSSTLSIPGLI